jgi:hypothetical protein
MSSACSPWLSGTQSWPDTPECSTYLTSQSQEMLMNLVLCLALPLEVGPHPLLWVRVPPCCSQLQKSGCSGVTERPAKQRKKHGGNADMLEGCGLYCRHIFAFLVCSWQFKTAQLQVHHPQVCAPASPVETNKTT